MLPRDVGASASWRGSPLTHAVGISFKETSAVGLYDGLMSPTVFFFAYLRFAHGLATCLLPVVRIDRKLSHSSPGNMDLWYFPQKPTRPKYSHVPQLGISLFACLKLGGSMSLWLHWG